MQKNDDNFSTSDKQTLKSNINLINPLATSQTGINTKKTNIKSKPERYSILMNQLKNNLNRNSMIVKLSSSKNLRLSDFDEKKPFFKLDENDENAMQYMNLNDEKKIIKSKTRNDNNGYDPLKTSTQLIKVEKFQNDNVNKRDDILLNFCYSIIEFFDNKKYNMDRLKPIDFSDIKKTSKDAQSNSLYKRLSVQEKKEYLKNLVEMRTQQNEMKNKRINHIMAEGKQIYLIKIKSDLTSIPRLNFFCNFKDEEIYYTKKCNLNNWILPPPDFYEKFYPAENNNNNQTEENYNNTHGNNNEHGKFYWFNLYFL